MYFTKNEIITLNNNKKYLVLDSYLINDNVYYKIKEVDSSEKKLLETELFITTINKDGKIFINDRLTTNEISMIKESLV